MSTSYTIADAIRDLKAGLPGLHFVLTWEYRHYSGGREEIDWQVYTQAAKFTRGPDLRACVMEAMEKHRAQAGPDTPAADLAGVSAQIAEAERRAGHEGGD